LQPPKVISESKISQGTPEAAATSLLENQDGNRIPEQKI